jgi:biopolymer transport protein ExbD
MRFRKHQPLQQEGFQIAPMIDIVFLLLIFFMAASIYAQWETKVGITVPTADSGISGTRQPGEIIINIDSEGRIFVNDFQVSQDRLMSLLGKVAETFRDQPVIIRADRDSRHKDVMAVLDICRQVDVWNVAFAALPGQEDEAEGAGAGTE